MLDQILQGAFSFMELAGTSGIPGLSTACTILEQIWDRVNQVKVNQEKCKVLRARCVLILITIRDNTQRLETTVLNPKIDDFITIIGGIHHSMNQWADWGMVKCFVNNDEVAGEIQRNMGQLDMWCQNFQMATQLQSFNLNTHMETAREADKLELKRILLAMLENQDQLRELISVSFANMDTRLTGVMETFQLELRSHPVDSPTHNRISRELLGMQQASGQLPPIASLEGHECKLVSAAPVAGSFVYDVYEGLWLGGEKVAVKVLRSSKASDDNMRRFSRQVDILHRMKSKYILRLYGVAPFTDSFYLVSPWCENGHAPKYLKLNPNADRLKLILEIAYGLCYLHSQDPPIAHGSLQGSNVLIGDGGGALLADFGLAKAVEDLTGVPFTQPTGNNGSYRWMAPELHEDGGQLTLKSDIYSWAMTALEIYSDKVPFSWIKTAGSVVIEVARGTIPDRPKPGVSGDRSASTSGSMASVNIAAGGGPKEGTEIPDRLWGLFVRCWARDPAQRPTILETIADLEDMRRQPQEPMALGM